MKNDIGTLIFSSILLLIGLFLLVYFFVVLVRSKRWAIVTGSITGSKIEEGKDSETNSTIYLVKISLAYNLPGLETINHNHNGSVYQSSNFNEASAKLSDYPIGGPIIVWCNPKKPQQYMLKEDISGSRGALVAGIALVGFGAVAAWSS